MLWHEREPVGICVFSAPAASLTLRTKYFGLTNPRSSIALQAMNRQLWLLSRVVIHLSWRGAGVAAKFVKKCCELCPVPWIETLTAMGRVNPFFERAGFTKVGLIRRSGTPAKRNRLSAASHAKSRFSEPVYYIRNNRTAGEQ